MSGGEIVAVGKAVEAIGKKALAEDDKTKEMLLRVAEDTPEIKAAARSMAARTAVKERVKLLLWKPFARMVGVSQEYFEDTFPDEIAAKVADIPDENLVTPAVSVAVPALQGLSYTFDEANLKEMYLNLLATASDDRRADQAHPAFAEIIKQLTPKETVVLNSVLRTEATAIVRLKHVLSSPPGSYRIMMTHLLRLVDATTKEPKEEPQAPTWVDNWQRLGLVSVTYLEFQTDVGAYDWVQERPEYVRLAGLIAQLTVDRGIMRTTDFSRQFFRAVTQ
jgi:Abortive infection alpha